jgi:mono/diheme cytochrome c family protein
VRDTAQRLIVERQDRSVAPALRAMLKRPDRASRSGVADDKARPDDRALVHALWTLNGLSALDRGSLITALHGHDRVVETAVRLSEQLLAGQPKDRPPTELFATVLRLAKETPDSRVRLQCAFTLSAVDHPAATNAVAKLLAAARDDKLLRDAALSGLAGRESDVLETLYDYADMAQRTPGGEALLAALASCVMTEAGPQRVSTLLVRAGDPPDAAQWRQTAILSGMAGAVKKRGGRRKRVNFDFEPKAFTALLQSEDDRVRELAKTIETALHWPGKAEEKQVIATPLTADQQKLFNEGKALFGATCAACHQPTGEGLEGKAPPLLDSPWLLGPDARVIRIVLNGVKGPIHIRDEVINMEMPSVGVLDDRQVASILTYARREWGHTGDPVEPETVAKVRKQTTGRPDAWTEEELLKVK